MKGHRERRLLGINDMGLVLKEVHMCVENLGVGSGGPVSGQATHKGFME